MIVALYIHRSVRVGAVVACMIATSGDEAFVMLAMFPRTALLLTLVLFVIGIVAGILTDAVASSTLLQGSCDDMVVHEEAVSCQVHRPSRDLESVAAAVSRSRHHDRRHRAVHARHALRIGGTARLELGAGDLSLLLSSLALFVVLTAPEHFIGEHLWRHVMVRHVPRIFLWTFGSIAVVVPAAGLD